MIAGFAVTRLTSLWGFITMQATSGEAFWFATLWIGASLFLMIMSGGIRDRLEWARVCGITAGIVSLVAFPVGTFFGGHVLLQLILRWEIEAETGFGEP